MWYSTRPPSRRSYEVTVAGYVGGPHQRSSWRGSDHSSQTRSAGASNSASSVMVRFCGSLRTSITVIGASPSCRRRRARPSGRGALATAPRTGRAGGGRPAAPRGWSGRPSAARCAPSRRALPARGSPRASGPPRSSSGSAPRAPPRPLRRRSRGGRCPVASRRRGHRTSGRSRAGRSAWIQPYGCISGVSSVSAGPTAPRGVGNLGDEGPFVLSTALAEERPSRIGEALVVAGVIIEASQVVAAEATREVARLDRPPEGEEQWGAEDLVRPDRGRANVRDQDA